MGAAGSVVRVHPGAGGQQLPSTRQLPRGSEQVTANSLPKPAWGAAAGGGVAYYYVPQ